MHWGNYIIPLFYSILIDLNAFSYFIAKYWALFSSSTNHQIEEWMYNNLLIKLKIIDHGTMQYMIIYQKLLTTALRKNAQASGIKPITD